MSAGAPDIGALLAQMGGMQGGGGMQGMMQGPPEQGEQAGGADPVEILKQIVDLAKQGHDAERDEEDSVGWVQILQVAQKLLAKDQADNDAAMGGSNARILRKAG